MKQASSVCQLYELHKVVVFADQLGNVDETSGILCSLLASDEEKSLYELIETGTLLLLSREEIFVRLLLYFVEKEHVERVEQIMKWAPLNSSSTLNPLLD